MIIWCDDNDIKEDFLGKILMTKFFYVLLIMVFFH
jgi:hypothetical protein